MRYPQQRAQGVVLRVQSGLDTVHVPFQGGGPANLPPALVMRLNGAINEALRDTGAVPQ